MSQTTEKLVKLLAQLPDPDPDGKLTGPDPESAEKLYREILAGGRESLMGLVDVLVVPGEEDDWRARYVLHGLAVYAGRPENESPKAILEDVLTSAIGGNRPKPIKRFLLRQLQVAGGPEVVAAIGSIELLHDEELCESAAQALLAIRQGAAEQFQKALPGARGACRLTIIQALGVLGDSSSIGALKEALGDASQDVRLAAAFALANGGDAGSAKALFDAAEVDDVWERDQQTNACLLLAEKLVAAGRRDEAARIYRRLVDTRARPEDRHAKQAAQRGLVAAAKG
ncbi:MAG: HEAT repeat domain-containing protein [Planctomycetota bacterium]|jgi:hypothetical protein